MKRILQSGHGYCLTSSCSKAGIQHMATCPGQLLRGRVVRTASGRKDSKDVHFVPSVKIEVA